MISFPLNVNTLRLIEILDSSKSRYVELQARNFHFCAHSNTHSLVIGLRKVPDLVLMRNAHKSVILVRVDLQYSP